MDKSPNINFKFMIMKRLNIFLMALITLAICWACSDDDDDFKAPQIGGNEAASISVSTDTVNVFNITRQIQSEAGLKEVVLTNKTENKEINKVTEFANPKDYTYNYDVDLSVYKSNTEVTLILSITDVAGNTTSQEIKLTVIVSEVKIYFQTEDEELNTYFDFYFLPFKIKCGSVTLKSVVVTLNGTPTTMEIKPKISDAFYFDFNAENLRMGDNSIKIDAQDNNGRTATININIVRKEIPQGLGDAYMNTPLTEGVEPYNISSRLDEKGRIKWFACKYYDEVMDMGGYGKIPMVFDNNYDFKYNDNNTLHKLVYTYNDGMGTETFTVFEFKYNAQNPQQVTEVITYKGGSDAGEPAADAQESVYADNFEYELGNIVKYSVEGKVYTPKYITVEGEQVRVDRMDYSAEAEGLEYSLAERIENPLYNSLCPAVVVIGSEKLSLDMLFYNKYLFTSLKKGTTEVQHYTIEKDAVTGKVGKVIWDGQDINVEYTYK